MRPLVTGLFAGPLIAFGAAVNLAILRGDEWSVADIAGVLTLAALIGAALARLACAAAGTGTPF